LQDLPPHSRVFLLLPIKGSGFRRWVGVEAVCIVAFNCLYVLRAQPLFSRHTVGPAFPFQLFSPGPFLMVPGHDSRPNPYWKFRSATGVCRWCSLFFFSDPAHVCFLFEIIPHDRHLRTKPAGVTRSSPRRGCPHSVGVALIFSTASSCLFSTEANTHRWYFFFSVFGFPSITPAAWARLTFSFVETPCSPPYRAS